jgi:ATP-dependent DNA ligase
MTSVLLTAPQVAKTAATVVEAAADRPAVLEPKYDGWRILAERDEGGELTLWTRTGNPVTGKCPAIEAELLRWMPPGSTLDGEVVAFERGLDGHVHSWNSVQAALGAGVAKATARSGGLTYVLFDVLRWGGVDWRTEPFHVRRTLLDSMVPAFKSDSVEVAPQLTATDEEYERLLALGYEGGVVKWLDAPYASGQRGKGWFKLKATATIDAVISGYKPGENGLTGMVGAIEFSQYDAEGDTWVHRVRCSGMGMAVRAEITAHQDEYLGRVIEVAHMGVMPPHEGKPYGAFRHSQFKRFRDDRDPFSVEVHDA